MTGLTLEAFVALGGRAHYGLLGMIFQRTGDTSLRVEVPYSEEAGIRWLGSLAQVVDDVRLGLPVECASTVLEAATDSRRPRFPPGILRVVEAAHGVAGSSPVFFEKLTIAAIGLMHDDGQEKDDYVARFLKERLTR